MGVYRTLYDFAAKAGSLEGYVYHKDKIDPKYLPRWVEHIVTLYGEVPQEAKKEFQDLCDETVGRTILSLLPSLGKDHEIIRKLKGLVRGKMPESPDDFPHKEQI